MASTLTASAIVTGSAFAIASNTLSVPSRLILIPSPFPTPWLSSF
jgi:hypothetical protein